jgi:hypothetical protein
LHEQLEYRSMGGGLWHDLGALVRSIGLAGRIPAIRRRAAGYVAAYEQVVAPIVESTMRELGPRLHVGRSLLAAGTKLSFLIAGYAEMAAVPFRADLAVLGGAVARLYDDLLDESDYDEPGCHELDRRLSILFNGGVFVPRTDVERLLHELYLEMERRLARDRDDPIFGALVAVHEYQMRSRQQRDPAISPPTLVDITQGKGGHATVVLFALLRPAMSDRELALIREVGGVLQLLDDYQDVILDRRAGVATSVTRGEVTLAHICGRLRELRSALLSHYDRVRPFFGVVYAILWISFLRHRWPRCGTGGPPARTPLDVLLQPGDNLVQKARQRFTWDA